jgi:hypothetical protein
MKVAGAAMFRPGDTVEVDGEYLVVTGIGSTGELEVSPAALAEVFEASTPRVFPGLSDFMHVGPRAPDWQGNCDHCGHRYAATDRDCPKCGGPLLAPSTTLQDYSQRTMYTCTTNPNVPMPGWIPRGAHRW